MEGRSSRWTALSFVVVLAVVSPFTYRWLGVLDVFQALVGVTIGGYALAAVAAANAYRPTRNPAMLLIAAGAGAAAATIFVFGPVTGVMLTFRVGLAPRFHSVSLEMQLAAGLTLAICLLVTRPWWDRRGRPPLRPARVVGAAAGSVALFGVAALTFLPRPGIVDGLVGPVYDVSALILALALTGVAAFALAAGRAATDPQPRVLAGWVCASSAAGMLAVLASTTLPATASIGIAKTALAWQAVMWPASAITLVLGVLATQHADAGRMRRVSDRAEEVLGGRAEVASMLAHEVRGPVASIKSLATTTLRSYAKLSDDERREFVGMIEQESSRLLETVTQSSLALKADARTLAFDLRIQPISAIVREGAAAADVRGHALEVTVPDDLRGRADRRWLAEAVRQLVDNAAKYSPTEAPIRVEATTNGADVTIDVIDQGPGVPPHRREEVFGRFVTWRPAGYEDRGGSGLGLFICRALVAEQGGQTALDGTPEGGTIARIQLPREG